MAQVQFEINDLASRDAQRAAAIEAALKAALAGRADLGPLTCCVFVVGWPLDRVRIELHGEDWFENLPLLPLGVEPVTVRQLAASLRARRKA
jgi:hypothetical protein